MTRVIPHTPAQGRLARRRAHGRLALPFAAARGIFARRAPRAHRPLFSIPSSLFLYSYSTSSSASYAGC